MLTIRTAVLDLALLNPSLEGTTPHVQLLRLLRWRNVEVEYVHGQSQSGAGVGNVHNTSNMTLNRRA